MPDPVEEGAVVATADESENTPLTPEQQAHADAVARGDVIEEPAEDAIDPDLLAEIAELSDDGGVVVDPKKEDTPVIPRARFNEINEENKALKAQLELLKVAPAPASQPTEEAAAAVQAPPDPREKIKELRRQEQDLRLEGDTEGANKIGDEIDDLILQTATQQAEARMSQKTDAAAVKTSMETVAARAYVIYPFLNVQSPDVDEDAVIAVRTRTSELIQRDGLSPAEALQKAVDEKGPKFAKLLNVSTQVDETTNGEQIKAAREKAALEKAAAASVLQPAILPNKDDKTDLSVNVENLTSAQIKSMTEEQKAKLRGDVL